MEIEAALIGGLVGGVVSLLISYFIASREIAANRKIAQAQLLLQVDEMMQQYQAVNIALRLGTWEEIEIPDDMWPLIDGYLGLFERLNVLIDTKLVERDIAERFYQYRLANIVQNEQILEKVTDAEKDSWRDFRDVCSKLDVNIHEMG